MSGFKVRQHQRNRRQGGNIFVKAHVDRDDPVVRKGCLNKKGKYSNRKVAAGAASMASNKYGVKFRSYHCLNCGSHHITTKKQRSTGSLNKARASMNFTTRLLTAISSTEPSTFSEVLNGLNGDRPEDKAGFREFFETVRFLEGAELVIVDWGPNNRVNSMVLTPLGAERAREALKGQDNGF